MPDDNSTSPLPPVPGAEELNSEPEESTDAPLRSWSLVWDRLLHLGLGESVIRLGTGFVSIILVLLVILVMDRFYLQGEPAARRHSAVAAPLPTESDPVDPPPFVLPANEISMQAGITRLVQGHTILPAHPRWDVFQYTVQKGDTIFAIAEKFNLRPETILWGIYYILGDDPHRLMAGQQINILPVDGVYYEWHSGDGLNGVADFYGVSADAIVDFPGNHLTRESVGNYSFPNIPSGTWLVIPGGVREFVSWSAPRITREDPSVAKIFGPGYCGEVMDGPIGYGTFIWPSIEKYLSGYDYSPETNHLGIDIAGNIGNAIFAVDNGVVVYAGWNDFGYGNVVVIDHGNGWQSLYAHMDSYNVQCGTYVYQGDVIGVVGSTGNSSGPHLHFELRSDEYGKVNPWNFLTQ